MITKFLQKTLKIRSYGSSGQLQLLQISLNDIANYCIPFKQSESVYAYKDDDFSKSIDVNAVSLIHIFNVFILLCIVGVYLTRTSM